MKNHSRTGESRPYFTGKYSNSKEMRQDLLKMCFEDGVNSDRNPSKTSPNIATKELEAKIPCELPSNDTVGSISNNNFPTTPEKLKSRLSLNNTDTSNGKAEQPKSINEPSKSSRRIKSNLTIETPDLFSNDTEKPLFSEIKPQPKNTEIKQDEHQPQSLEAFLKSQNIPFNPKYVLSVPSPDASNSASKKFGVFGMSQTPKSSTEVKFGQFARKSLGSPNSSSKSKLSPFASRETSSTSTANKSGDFSYEDVLGSPSPKGKPADQYEKVYFKALEKIT